jgi:hypothetical protein
MIWLEFFFFFIYQREIYFPFLYSHQGNFHRQSPWSCPNSNESQTRCLGSIWKSNYNLFYFSFTLVRKQVHMLRGLMLSVREIRKVFNWKISGSFLSWVHDQINWVCKTLNQHENISTIVKISCFNQRLLSLVSVNFIFFVLCQLKPLLRFKESMDLAHSPFF